MTSADGLRFIVDSLNSHPFNANLTLIKFDAMTPEKLLQTLSDVIGWVHGMGEDQQIDIRGETPDETAMRLLNSLRILKYPAPRDIDQIQKWRLGILEGDRSAVCPVLEWIFENVDRLKERVYLASYLTKLEIPVEEQSPDVVRLMQMVEDKMEEFKAVHSRIVETRSDFLRAEDVRSDLKSMEEEKEQLLRRTERCKRKVARRSDLPKFMGLAAKLRLEGEHQQELDFQRQEQLSALTNSGQRLSRLERTLAELEKEKDAIDPRTLIAKLKREIETNSFVLNDRIMVELEAQRKGIEGAQKILGTRTVTKENIAALQEKAKQLTDQIEELTQQRDQKDDVREDKLAVYRHQSVNAHRKKANVGEALQSANAELEFIEGQLAVKKRELTEKSGKEHELISPAQYKAYVAKLRHKSNHYKRLKLELEQCRSEVQILERTVELLTQRFEELKVECKREGRSVIEAMESDVPHLGGVPHQSIARPRTAKPTSTDSTRLKEMIEEINAQLDERRQEVQALSQQIEQFQSGHREQNERFYGMQTEFQSMEKSANAKRKSDEEEVRELEEKMERLKADIAKNKDQITKQRWFVENTETPTKTEAACQHLEKRNNDCLKQIGEINKELAELLSRGDLGEQMAMWKSLVLIFEAKMKQQRWVR